MFVDLHSATGKNERLRFHYYHDLSVSSGAGAVVTRWSVLISRRVTAAEREWLERRCGGLAWISNSVSTRHIDPGRNVTTGRACENADAGDLGRLLRHDDHSNSKQCHRYQDWWQTCLVHFSYPVFAGFITVQK
jgi:hypothetical protein